MNTETIDRLFLELSQFTTAKTRREIHLEEEIARLKGVIALAEGQRMACGGNLTPSEVVDAMRAILWREIN
jgi:hypothetical protein